MTREEAIKELRGFIGQLTEGCQEAIKVLIPELEESEDERIRKFLVELVSNDKANNFRGFYDIREMDFDNILAWLEKQKEQKPVELDEYKIIKKHITEDMLSSEVNKRLTECGWYVTDEKPAEWSEEDEAMRDNILRLLSCFVGTSECDTNPSLSTSYPAYQKEIDWLKSLKPQPKQDWIKEQTKTQ